MLSATPRLPDEDSTMIESGVRSPSRSALSTISVAALTLTDPAKLKPSHLRNSGSSNTGSRATKRASSFKDWGLEMIVTTDSSPQSGGRSRGSARLRTPGGAAPLPLLLAGRPTWARASNTSSPGLHTTLGLVPGTRALGTCPQVTVRILLAPRRHVDTRATSPHLSVLPPSVDGDDRGLAHP